MNPYGQTAGVTSEDQNLSGDNGTQVQDNTITTSSVSPTDQANSVTLAHIAGFFNIVVGLMLVASLLLFFGGFIAYLTRLGLESRLQGLQYMYWGLTILFVLIVLLGLIHYVQFHTTIVIMLIAVVAVLFGVWVAVQVARASGHDEEGEH